MAWYAIFKSADGELVSVGTVLDPAQVPADCAFTVLAGQPEPGQAWNPVTHSFVSLYTVEYIDAAGIVRKIQLDHEPTEQDIYNAQFPYMSKLQLRKLFTLEERMALDNIEASAADAQVKALINTIKQDFAVADFISLQDPLTVQAIGTLETYGLLAAGRAAQILAGVLPA